MAPFPIFGNAPTDNIEVHLPQMSSHVTDLAGSDGSMVDACDRANLRACSAKEHLIGEIQFGPVDLTFLNLGSKFIPEQLDNRPTRDSFENIVCNRRSRKYAIAEHEEISGRPFRNVTIRV